MQQKKSNTIAFSEQVLDAESEKKRRNLASKAIIIPRLIEILQGEISLIEAIHRDLEMVPPIARHSKRAHYLKECNTDFSNMMGNATSQCQNKVLYY